jgi:hypothetical protein
MAQSPRCETSRSVETIVEYMENTRKKDPREALREPRGRNN